MIPMLNAQDDSRKNWRSINQCIERLNALHNTAIEVQTRDGQGGTGKLVWTGQSWKMMITLNGTTGG